MYGHGCYYVEHVWSMQYVHETLNEMSAAC